MLLRYISESSVLLVLQMTNALMTVDNLLRMFNRLIGIGFSFSFNLTSKCCTASA